MNSCQHVKAVYDDAAHCYKCAECGDQVQSRTIVRANVQRVFRRRAEGSDDEIKNFPFERFI